MQTVCASAPRSLLVASLLLTLAGALSAQAPLNFSVLAGSPPSAGHEDGPGVSARFAFSYTSYNVVDPAGNTFLTDPANHTVRRITPAGYVTTFAGMPGSPGSADGKGGFARFNGPTGIDRDAAGNLYVMDAGNGTVRKITPAGVVSTIAGTPGIFGASDSVGIYISFGTFTGGIAVKSDGSEIYITDYNSSTVRKLMLFGGTYQSGTVAGIFGVCDYAPNALCFPSDVVLDETSGNLYIVSNGTAEIDVVYAGSGIPYLFAGGGGGANTDGGPGVGSFSSPWAITRDAGGDFFVTDEFNYNVRRFDNFGNLYTFAGPNSLLCDPTTYLCPNGTVDGTGTGARFNGPEGIAFDPTTGDMVVTDYQSNDVRRISPAAAVTRIAGIPASVGSADGSGAAAQFRNPNGISKDSNFIYVADTGNNTIRKVDGAGNVTTLAGAPQQPGWVDDIGAAARFNSPTDTATFGNLYVFVADRFNRRIRRVDSSSGQVVTIAGVAAGGAQDGGLGVARFRRPRALAYDPSSGNIYVADNQNHNIRKIDYIFTGDTSTLAGPNQPLCTGSSPNFCPRGSTDGAGTAARFSAPSGIAVDAFGNVFVADTGNQTIRQITPAGDVTTVAGSPGLRGAADGTGAAARFNSPSGLSFDATGNLLIADTGNHMIRQMTPAGVVTTLAGTGRIPGSGPGTGKFARFFNPGKAISGFSGTLTVADPGNQSLRTAAAGLADTAAIDAPFGPPGIQRQLFTSPNTATSWLWRPGRIPTGSVAALSSTLAQNPTFTPDVADFYSFEATATNGGGVAGATETGLLTARNPVIISSPIHRPASGKIGQYVLFGVQDLALPVSVYFSDGFNPTIPAPLIYADPARGIIAVTVPDAQTGAIKVTTGGLDTPPYYFRVMPGTINKGTDRVSGQITGPGGPLAGVGISLLRELGCNGSQELWDSTITDAGGNYTLYGVDGTYSLLILAPLPAGVANGSASVTLSATPLIRNLSLTSGTTVTGTVTSGASGQPVAGAGISFQNDCGSGCFGGFELLLSDAAGNFSAHLFPGTWKMEVNPSPDGALARYKNEMLAIGASSPQNLGTVTLADGVRITGRVARRYDGTPLSGVVVRPQIDGSGGDPVDEKPVLGDGGYTVIVPPNQTYRMQLEFDNTAPYIDPNFTTPVGVTPMMQGFALEDAGFITGTVTDSGTGLPVAGLEIEARFSSGFGYAGSTTTCTDGSYRLQAGLGGGSSVLLSTRNCTGCSNPPPPPYANQTYRSGGNSWFYCEGTPLTLASAGSTISGINFSTPRAATVTGSFYTAPACTTVDGSVNPFNVTLDDGAAHACGLGETVSSPPSPAGTYQITALPPSGVFAGGIRSCYSGGGTYSSQCSYKKLSPAYDPITVASTGSAVANFCLGNQPTAVLGNNFRLTKSGSNLNFVWNASADLYHDHYRIYQTTTAKPVSPPGSFPGDPFPPGSYSDVFSGTSTSFNQGAGSLYFLVVDTGISGNIGPSGSYGY